jgi:mannose-6-phosphate isomerase-like protein (cupin superfamily)
MARPLSKPRPRVCKVNLAEKFRRIRKCWSPRVAARVNDSLVKLVKVKGKFVWHHHAAEDEMFLVVRGRLRMKLRGRELMVNEGEFVVIPRGVEHRPMADEETHVLLFEPASTLNTGNVRNARTIRKPARI